MAKALQSLDETYGGIERYLLGPCGMSRTALNALKTALIT